MGKERNDPKVKPIEEWTTKEWEAAYNVLLKKYESLRNSMRMALAHLNKAI